MENANPEEATVKNELWCSQVNYHSGCYNCLSFRMQQLFSFGSNTFKSKFFADVVTFKTNALNLPVYHFECYKTINHLDIVACQTVTLLEYKVVTNLLEVHCKEAIVLGAHGHFGNISQWNLWLDIPRLLIRKENVIFG